MRTAAVTRLLTSALLIAVLLPDRQPTAAAAGVSHDLSTYRLLAIRQLRARALRVQQGDIGVDVDDPSGLLTVNGRLEAPVSQVAAHTVELTSNSQCAALFEDAELGASCLPSGQSPGSFDGPIIPLGSAGGAFTAVARACGFPATFACDPKQARTVPRGGTLTLAPGRYGSVLVAGGDLILAPGQYDFCAIQAARNSKVLVQDGGVAQVRVAGDVSLGNNSRVGPLDLFVQGSRVRLARAARLEGRLCAPSAMLTLLGGDTLEGTFVADRVRAGQGISLTPPAPRPTTTTTTSTSTSSTTTTTTSTSTSTSSTSSTTIPCPPDHCGDGIVQPACGEQCDGSAFGGFTCGSAGGTLRCTADCQVDTSGCHTPEICGDCIDNDGNGLTDFEDPACCTETQHVVMSLRRARIRPKGGLSRLRLKSILAGLGHVDPTRGDVFLQIREEGGEMLCAHIPPGHFVRKRHAFTFKDKAHRVADAHGLDRVVLWLRHDGTVRVRAIGKGTLLTGTPRPGSLEITVGFRDAATAERTNRCSAATASFRTGKGKRAGVRFP